MNDAYAVALLGHGNSDSTLDETLQGVAEAHDFMHASALTLRAKLRKALPNLPASKARFVALLLIANKSEQLRERATDLLIEELKADPSLQELIDALQSEDYFSPSEVI